MKKVFICMFFIFNLTLSLAEENFEEKQKTLQDIKQIILYEESFSRAYQEYLVSNYAFPTLKNIQDMGVNIDATNTIHKPTTFVSAFTKLSYGLKEESKNSLELKTFYESDNFRKSSYIKGDSVYLILGNDFANHLYGLLKQKEINKINDCFKPSNDNEVTVTKNTCIHKKHIYIDLTKFKNKEPSAFLMAYHIDNFKSGPIVFDKTQTLPDSLKDLIIKGSVLYDFDGKKYLKTEDSILELK